MFRSSSAEFFGPRLSRAERTFDRMLGRRRSWWSHRGRWMPNVPSLRATRGWDWRGALGRSASEVHLPDLDRAGSAARAAASDLMQRYRRKPIGKVLLVAVGLGLLAAVCARSKD